MHKYGKSISITVAHKFACWYIHLPLIQQISITITMSRWFCNRQNPNDIARSKTALNAPRITVIVNVKAQQTFLDANIQIVWRCDAQTARILGDLVSKLFYQGIDYAQMGSTAQSFYRLACPICTNNTISARPDIYADAPRNLPIIEKKYQQLLECVLAGFIRLCLNLGMHADDTDKVTVVALDNEPSAGTGVHGDSPTVEDEDDLSCRIIIRYGGQQHIIFQGYTCKKEDTQATRKVDGLTTSIETSEGIMAYLTTPFSNGKLMMCWQDTEKKVGIQAKHRVTRVAHDGKPAVAFVIDFPLRSLRAVKEAIAKFNALSVLQLDVTTGLDE